MNKVGVIKTPRIFKPIEYGRPIDVFVFTDDKGRLGDFCSKLLIVIRK